MTTKLPFNIGTVATLALLAAVGCDDNAVPTGETGREFASSGSRGGAFTFTPLPTSAVCVVPGGNPVNPLVLPSGFTQHVIASEPQFQDLPDMVTQNETGPQAGRFLYRAHEVGSNASVSVTDLSTGETHNLAQRADWERLDGIVWSPWGTLLTGEETNAAALNDPAVPQATAGLMYEIDPVSGSIAVRPALGSKSHEGMRFDAQGNFYGISERNPGFIFKFIPDRRGDLSSGQLYALKITEASGDRTGKAVWLPLDRTAVQINADVAAQAAGATGYDRPEDVELATSTGNNRGGQILYVAITGPADNRVVAVDLREPAGGSTHSTAFVYDYVLGNAVPGFAAPDNLALNRQGDLYITEDPGGNFPAKTTGDDIWVARPGAGGPHQAAASVERFATLTDCDGEPTGIYFETTGQRLFVNIQHRGGDGLDKSMAISQE